MKSIQAGLLGIGTVGSGVFRVLQRNQEEIRRRAGRGIEITMVADLDTERARSVVGDGVQVVDDARAVIANPDIDIVIELIGGLRIARELVMEAIAAGKHVVTANKALLAVHGTEIFEAAHRRGVMVAFEAAVAGGIPIIKALREGLTANSIEWIAGIINGTTNFILSEMRDKGLDFEVALRDAHPARLTRPVRRRCRLRARSRHHHRGRESGRLGWAATSSTGTRASTLASASHSRSGPQGRSSRPCLPRPRRPCRRVSQRGAGTRPRRTRPRTSPRPVSIATTARRRRRRRSPGCCTSCT